MIDGDGQCNVFVRMRPLPTDSTERDHIGTHELVEVGPEHVVAKDIRGAAKTFSYPRVVIPGEMDQETAFAQMRMPELVDRFLLEGQHCTLVAYGQTGSGKTHTMFGVGMDHDESTWGLLPRALTTSLAKLDEMSKSGTDKFVISATAIELYGLEVFDLLNDKANIQISAFSGSGFDYEQCKELVITGYDDVCKLLHILFCERTSRGTKMNDRSSRAHCIASINLTRVAEEAGAKICYRSSFVFADLCGSERTSKTGAAKTSATGGEGIGINYDLHLLHFAVEQSVQAQKNPKASKIDRADGILSKVLKTALDGLSLTNLVVCCSQEPRNGGETFFTLKWGEDMSRLKLKQQTCAGKDVVKELARIDKEVEQETAAIKQLEANGGASKNKFYPKRVARVAQLRTQQQFLAQLV